MKHHLVLFAPNVHTGGGFVLLQALLQARKDGTPLMAYLDARARDRLVLPQGMEVVWVTPRPISRLRAEFSLKVHGVEGCTILCFHGMPPLLSSRARVVIFQQNRNYLKLNPLSQFAWKTRIRISFERFVSRAFRYRATEYIVQTPSMQRALTQWYGNDPSRGKPVIRVLPFMDDLVLERSVVNPPPTWDFVYVSDGEAHKNHRTLLAAWRLLAAEGLRPSLALTLGVRDGALVQEIEQACAVGGLSILNLGQLPRDAVMDVYRSARALIFPSVSESFGLPLIEATLAGLPILAPELDYVRDVCSPRETFDPSSPMSIMRAVKRFLALPDPPVTLYAPEDFWREVSRKHSEDEDIRSQRTDA